MKHFKSVLAMLLALVMVLSCIGTAFATEKTETKELTKKTEITNISKDNKEAKGEALKGFKSESFKMNNAYQYADDEIVRAIVILEGETEADAGAVGSTKAADQRVKLVNQHNTVFKAMAGIKYELKFEYTRLLNGFSCDVAYGDLEAIAAIDGVVSVHIANSFAQPVLQTSSDTKQNIANQIVGNDYMHGELWDGYGTVVAVLDTGLALDHEAFQPVEYWIDEVVTEETVAAADLWVDGKYVSAKVPFAYDYADGDNDVTDHEGHGTHVSGSAVGLAGTLAEDGESFNVTFAGAAPAAQLLSMKIFTDGPGGTTSDIYFYALEDAYTLGADVINMSIGAQNGFTYDTELETEVFGNIYQRLSDAGVILSVAAGNEYSMAANASSYNGYMQAIGPEYTDYGTVASPSTYEGNVSVASMENAAYPDYAIEIDGQIAPFADSCEDGVHGWLQNFGGKSIPYQVILDAEGKISLGTVADFATYDAEMLEGKIAIVSRGSLDFEEKVENAYNAGAIGCIVVNNDVGIISMAIDTFEIPAITLQQSALELLSVTGTITVLDSITLVENANAYLMSDFSNWGTSPMLTLDPTITAIGGMVYSSVPGGTDTYEVYSGTSMAAPNMTGMYAALLSGIYEEYPDMEKAEAAELAKDLIYSTAILLTDADEYHYSPRKTGAGLGCAWNAIWALKESAYITNPIQELGDDPEKTGVYEMAIELKNMSEFDLFYSDFEAYVLYDYLTSDEEGTIINYMVSEYAYLMNDEFTDDYGRGASVSYSIDGTEITEVNLAAGESVIIDVTITLTEDQKDFFDAYYPNGSFVEGYVVFNEIYEGEVYTSNHATFLAYYGDWTQGNVLEEADFMDIIDVEYFLNTTVADEAGNTYGDNGYTWADVGLINYYTNPNIAYITDAAITTAYAYAGDSMLGSIPYYPEHIAFSTPLTDGTYNYAETIYMEPYQLRNARNLIMTVSDKETGEIYYVDDTQYSPKAVYDYDYAMWFATATYTWDGTDADGEYVPSGTVATISYDAVLPYGETLHEDIWGFDVTVDYTAPVLEDVVLDLDAQTLTVTASDENYLQAIYLADMYYEILDSVPFSSDVKGESFTATFDISGIMEENDMIYVTALDYATNEMEELVYLFELDQPATVTLNTPYGVKTVDVLTGDEYLFEAGPAIANGDFMFWATEPVETATDDDIWDVGGDAWYFEGDIVLVTGDITVYALYAVGDVLEYEQPNYWYTQDTNYNGVYALCGWNYDYDNDRYIVEDPVALTNALDKVTVADIEGAVVSEEYVEFFTSDPSIAFTLTSNEKGSYTIQDADGKYMALVNGELVMLDEFMEEALWNVYLSAETYGTLIYNVVDEAKLLVYDDDEQVFAIMDDSAPMDWALAFGFEIYPSEYYQILTYKCETTYIDEDTLYYTTEVDVTVACYFDDFTDCKDAWYHEAVDFAVANGLMNGVGNNKFEPQETLTRAMVVTVLYREAGSPAVSESSTFTDVMEGQWYSDAIAWAQDNEIVNGVSATEFAPEQDVTREQIATILWRYAGEPKADTDMSQFADADTISSYAKDAMAWAVAEGIFKGDAEGLRPLDNATRAEFACIIMRYLGGSYICNE